MLDDDLDYSLEVRLSDIYDPAVSNVFSEKHAECRRLLRICIAAFSQADPRRAAVTGNETENQIAKAFIREAIRARAQYRGSGKPTLFITDDMLTKCLLLEDEVGRMIYDSVDKLATALRVSKIVTVPVMENQTRTDTLGQEHELAAIIVNMADYNVGADKGGAVNMFDDFDIDYNAQKYLIETRCSGALVKPYSAIAIEMVEAASEGGNGNDQEQGE